MSVQQNQSELDTDLELETDVQPTVEAEPEAVVMNSGELMDMAEEIADTASIRDYTAPRSDINHGHDTGKHDVRSSFGVRDEFVKANFTEYGIAPNDHAALWLMSYKKEEFISSDEQIFSDTSDQDPSRWSSIESTRKSAPIAPETQRQLKR
jgi:hypothetical protein